jgi:WD40 repeat protein
MIKKIFKRFLLAGILFLIALLIYHQFFFKAKRVESNIYKSVRVLQSHRSDVWSAKFDATGRWLASGSVDSTIIIWDVKQGTPYKILEHPAGVTSLDLSPDGNFLVSASYDSKIRLWKLPEGILYKELTGQQGTVWSVDFNPDGKTLASCGEDKMIRTWDVSTGQLLKTMPGHERNVWDIKYSADGKILASGSFDKTIKIWNAVEGKLLQTISSHTEAVVSLAFSHDGKKLVSTSDDKTIKIWNTVDWSLFLTLDVPEHAQSSDFSPDDRFLLTAGRDKPATGEFLQNFFGDSKMNKGVSMRLWEVQTGRLLQTFDLHANDVNDATFSRDGKWIASASSDKTIGIWGVNGK